MKPWFSTAVILVWIVTYSWAAWAQEAPPDADLPSPDPSPVPPAAGAADAEAVRLNAPAFVLAARPFVGVGFGSVDFRVNDVKEETTMPVVASGGVELASFIPATEGRSLVITVAFPVITGHGGFDKPAAGDYYVRGGAISFIGLGMKLGGGWQRGFGEESRTNLFVLGRMGGVIVDLKVPHGGGTFYNNSALAATGDLAVGTTYRFEESLVVGGSLDLAATAMSTGLSAGDETSSIHAAHLDARWGELRLSLLLGHAWF